MEKLNNTLIETVDRFSRKIGILNTLLDRVIARVVPQQIATACGGFICYSQTVLGGPCKQSGFNDTTYRYWAPSGSPNYPSCETWVTCYDIVCP